MTHLKDNEHDSGSCPIVAAAHGLMHDSNGIVFMLPPQLQCQEKQIDACSAAQRN